MPWSTLMVFVAFLEEAQGPKVDVELTEEA